MNLNDFNQKSAKRVCGLGTEVHVERGAVFQQVYFPYFSVHQNVVSSDSSHFCFRIGSLTTMLQTIGCLILI